jgi:hypothetical protein
MGGASPAAYNKLKRVIKFVLNTKINGLFIDPNFYEIIRWHLVVYSDSDWAKNQNSVTGYILYLIAAPTYHKVALSCTKVEYYAY